MRKGLQKGFTLIELLVVIAIIGILAGIVLTSLGTARNKGKDAAAQASMSSMRAEAELAVQADGKYPTALCTGALSKLRTSAANNTGHTSTCVVSTDAMSWASEIQLSGTAGKYFCVDSAGVATTTDATQSLTTSNADCS